MATRPARRTKPTLAKRVDALEGRMTSIEVAHREERRLNRLTESKLDNVGAGVRASNETNYRISLTLGEIRERLDMNPDVLMANAAARGEAWRRKKSVLDGEDPDIDRES